MTAAELIRLPSGQFRYELINGELKTMSPSGHTHGRISVRLTVPLAQFVWDNNLGEVFGAETGFLLTTNPDTVLAPDVSFIRKERATEARKTTGYWPGPPDLAVEVLSPSERPTAVKTKVSEWLEFGAKEVWVVDPKTCTVTIQSKSENRVLTEDEDIEGRELIPGFHIPVKRLFEL